MIQVFWMSSLEIPGIARDAVAPSLPGRWAPWASRATRRRRARLRRSPSDGTPKTETKKEKQKKNIENMIYIYIYYLSIQTSTAMSKRKRKGGFLQIKLVTRESPLKLEVFNDTSKWCKGLRSGISCCSWMLMSRPGANILQQTTGLRRSVSKRGRAMHPPKVTWLHQARQLCNHAFFCTGGF